MKTTFMHIGIAFVFFMLCASCSDDKELTPEIPKQPLAGTMTDLRDNNTYATITLGVQTWLAENLRYLPQIDNTTSSKEGRYYILYFTGTDVVEAREDKFYKAYGVYYNLPAALHGAAATTGAEQTPVQGICPEGWHLPTTREWRMLSEYVVSHNMLACDADGVQIEGAVAKALASKTMWQFPPESEMENKPQPGYVAYHLEENDATGFNGLPIGFRGVDTETIWWHGCYSAGWWSSTQGVQEPTFGMPVRMWSDNKDFSTGYSEFNPGCALPVRCVKD